MVLSSKVRDNELLVFESLCLKDISTKKMRNILDNVSAKGKILISMARKDENLIKSARSIPNISFLASDSLNVSDLLKNKILITDKKSIKKIKDTYL